jgi:AcrR family transcriptional regulator
VTRRSGNETRSAFLEAGARLLVSFSFNQLVRPITIEMLCNAVGLTHGAFYFHWSSKSAFDQDLLTYLTTAIQEQENADAVEGQISPSASLSPESLATSVRGGALATWDYLSSDPTLRAQVLLSAMEDQVTQARVRTLYDGIVATYEPVYMSWADSLGLEPRPPFTWRRITITLALISETFATLGAFGFDPGGPGWPAASSPSGPNEGTSAPASESVRDTYADVIMSLTPALLRPSVKTPDPDMKAEFASAEEYANERLAHFVALAARHAETPAPVSPDPGSREPPR